MQSGGLTSKGDEVYSIKPLDEIGITIGTKLALGLHGCTLDQARRLLGWSESKMVAFMSGKYDLKYSEIYTLSKYVQLQPEDLFND